MPKYKKDEPGDPFFVDSETLHKSSKKAKYHPKDDISSLNTRTPIPYF